MKRLAIATITLSVTAAGLVAFAARSAGPTPEAPRVTGAGTYGVDPVHSSVQFRIKHVGVTNFYGRFNGISGSWSFDPEDPETGSFEFEIDNATVDTANARRDDHLRSADFFNARQFPTTSFVSTRIEPGENGTFKLHGDLTLHGETKPIAADLRFMGEGELQGKTVASFEAVFTIKRADFGMTKYMAADESDSGPLGNTVQIIVSVEGPEQ